MSAKGNCKVIDGTNGRYEREDFTLFRSIRTISQLSGVPPESLRKLIAKELADNALDVCGVCCVGELPDGGFYVEDDGPGISGTPEEIARLFSFGRPLVSSKLIRLPTRGALGNGLRVVAGAVFASDGSLRVITHGRELELSPQESGETLVRERSHKRRTGTRIEVELGEAIPADFNFLEWAELAITARGDKPIYSGKTSPSWYDSDSFFELLKAAGTRSVRDVIQDFDGCSRAGEITAEFKGRVASSLTYDEAEQLLWQARSSCKAVRPERLALLRNGLPGCYARALGTLELEPGRGTVSAELPYTVEAWCNPSYDEEDYVTIFVNRSPVTGEAQIERAAAKTNVTIFGCNLGYQFKVGRKPIALVINVQVPYMPITTQGKEPDLELFLAEIREAVESAAKRCQRANRSSEDRTHDLLPTLPKGRPSDEARDKYAADQRRFADLLKEINSRIDFKVSSRGWCYILENDHGLSKGDFDRAQDLINDCRKNGLLPIDFTVEDESRSADHLEHCHEDDPRGYAVAIADRLHQWDTYLPVSFWHNQPVYVQLLVEKIDLKSLFSPVCKQFCVPLINARGWSDLNLRAGLMRRFKEHERQGRQPILLYCGDLDPVGLQIAERLMHQLEELERAVGWSPRNLTIERFGLNLDFVEEHNLTWIDGLYTGSGKDLGDPNHRQHRAGFVQQYIAQYGKRKVEANALVVRPQAGRQLCLKAIQKHLDLRAIEAYQQALVEHRAQVRIALPEAVKGVLQAFST